MLQYFNGWSNLPDIWLACCKEEDICQLSCNEYCCLLKDPTCIMGI